MLKKIIATLLVGFVIKLLDDYIDDEIDVYKYEKAILPYALIILCIACGFHKEYSVTLFSASYMIGMFHDLKMKLPTGLNAYVENIGLFILNSFFFSIHSMMTSLIVVVCIQFIDDLIDMKKDLKYGYQNFAIDFGKGETFLMSLMMIVLLILLDQQKLFCVAMGYLITVKIYSKTFEMLHLEGEKESFEWRK